MNILFNALHLRLKLVLVLDDRIEKFAEIVREHYKLSELGDPSTTTEVSSMLYTALGVF